MYAEHIVGLTARERFSDTIAQSAAIRFAAIKADGVLRPYNADRPVGAQGNIFELDHLAGDSACVFLSVGARYREYIEPDAAYGFVFDARHLILEHGAIVGVDMLQHYEDLLEQCIAEVAATLPPLLMILTPSLPTLRRWPATIPPCSPTCASNRSIETVTSIWRFALAT